MAIVFNQIRFETDTEVPSILSSIASRTTTNAQIQIIQKFSDENKLEDKNLRSSLQSAEFNLKWANENVPEIISILSNNAVTNTISIVVLMCAALVTYFNN